MKRFLLIIAMMLLSLGASAQISNVTTYNGIHTIAKFRAGMCALKEQDDVYYLTLKSTSRYDNAIIVYLGSGKDSAVQTLKDLLDLHKSMDKRDYATFTINIEKQRFIYSVCKYDMFNFTILDKDIAGTIYLATSEIKNLIMKLTDE